MIRDAAPKDNTTSSSPKDVGKSKHFVTVKHHSIDTSTADCAGNTTAPGSDQCLPSVKDYFQNIRRKLDFVLTENHQLLQLTVSDQKNI